MTTANSLTEAENERAFAALQALVDKYGSLTATAATLRMPDGRPPSKQVLSGIVVHGNPIGVSLARAIAREMGISFDELVSGQRSAQSPGGTRRYNSVPGWNEAAAEVCAKGGLAPHVVDAAGAMTVAMAVDQMTPSLVFDLALFWTRHASFEERLAVEKAAFAAKQGSYAEAAGPQRVVAKSGVHQRSGVRAESDAPPAAGAKRR